MQRWLRLPGISATQKKKEQQRKVQDAPAVEKEDRPLINATKAQEMPVVDVVPTAQPTSFTVQVVGVRGIGDSEQLLTDSNPDYHINVMRAGNLIGTTNVIADLWSEELVVTEYNEGDELEFKVFAEGGTKTDYLGMVAMKPEQFAANGFNDSVLLEDTGADFQAYLSLKIKPQGKEYPADPASTFTVEVEKGETGSYGMDLDSSDGKHLIVHDFAAGAFTDYNKSAELSKQLLKSDFILSVNEISSPKDCLKQFKESKVTLVMTRGIQFSCILERENLQTPLGLVFPAKVKRTGYGLPIVDVSVTEGAAKEYNDKCIWEWDKLKAYDRIVSVEDETWQPRGLEEKLEAVTGKIRVQILRPAHTRSECTSATGLVNV